MDNDEYYNEVFKIEPNNINDINFEDNEENLVITLKIFWKMLLEDLLQY